MISKKYFSGFCLCNESELFKDYLEVNDFTVSGFSYGAILAFEEVLNSNQRVDKLQLFSPSFFQTQDKKFIRMQLMFFKKDAKAYCDNFLENIAYPEKADTSKYFSQGTYEQLEELLTYKWDKEKLQKLVDKGTKIEVFLGQKDKIIQSDKANDFFVNFATVYYIKEKGHIL
ncbi:pimelyl-ACP methyl ester esterase BioV [Poseidonibacter sp.]|uniref:pimelyl-ACP methyl ester esterase BioV n=1 Tax=Poseidonibacter sp. TaxID=2321188 RepID=UPI003C794210